MPAGTGICGSQAVIALIIAAAKRNQWDHLPVTANPRSGRSGGRQIVLRA